MGPQYKTFQQRVKAALADLEEGRQEPDDRRDDLDAGRERFDGAGPRQGVSSRT